jgi:predicted  nucleic acid-binding Zn-ribbon protein
VDDIAPLLEVQEHDLALDRLRHRRITLPERPAVAAAEAAIAALEAEAKAIRVPLGELTRTEERLEDEAQGLSDQATAADKRLYSGEVTSPKELQALQADVEQLRRHQRAVEEQAIEIMEQREPLESELTVIATRHEQRSAELAAARAALAASEQEIDAEVALEREMRDTAAAPIDEPVLALYEKCRSAAASGFGAARLVGHTCQGCHLTIPATEVDRIRKAPPGAVSHCDNCGAILIP